jgi:chemotaxis protein MotB
MGRRRAPEEHENLERWLVSYADFITLLFAFFVVMYSISSINEGKYKILSDSLVGVFNQVDRSVKPITAPMMPIVGE